MTRTARVGYLAACALLLGAGCALYTKAAVGVREVGATATQAKLNANAIQGETPSTFAREALESLDLEEKFDKEPDEALRLLHKAALDDKDRRMLYALAELSYAVGKRLHSRSHYLAAAVYAYCYLFDNEATDLPNPFDRRYRWACDIYNLGLEFALVPEDLGYLDLASVPKELPVGHIEIALDRSHFPWREELFPRFVPADEYDVFGLSLRYRRAGLGVPLIGAPSNKESGWTPAPADKYLGKSASVPATAFLRFEGGIAALEKGIAATLELASGYHAAETRVAGAPVPLESDLSASLAYTLGTNPKIWEFSLTGFFSGEANVGDNRLVMVRPYEARRIPVVFVHGTASTPGYWAEMFNTLQADPLLRDSMQFWFFVYKTGNPIAYSAATLRDDLRDAIHTFDPDGTDAALRHMVVIGHSQGGLLTRMMVTHADLGWLKDMYGQTLEDFKLTPEQEKIVRWGLEFEPVPEVQRVVFMCTPHRGSFLAKGLLGQLTSGLIALPKELLDFSPKLAESQKELPESVRVKGIGTSVQNMDANNPLLKRLGQAPIAPGVIAHSIIARDGGDTLEDSDDGVVAYKSSHLDGVASEYVVSSGHSCQANPLAIREVRRILIEHLRASGLRPEGAAGTPHD